MSRVLFCFLALLGLSSAFLVPTTPAAPVVRRARALQMSSSDSTYWDGKAPESKVLGPWLQNVPSVALGPLSIICLGAGVYFAHDHNIFHTMSVDSIDYKLHLGSFLTPLSWGLHVAAWIQKENGK